MVTQQTSMDGDKPRKILFCIDCLVRGGTELQVIGMIERLDPKKYQPYLLTIRETDKALVPKNCQHLAWQVPKLFSLNGIKQLYKLVAWLKREKVTIVQSYFQDSTLLAGIAAKALKEARYHLEHSSAWVVTLGDGTEESHHRTQTALNHLWQFSADLFATDQVEDELTESGVAANPDDLRPIFDATLEQVLAAANLTVPEDHYQRLGGRTGLHTAHLGHLLPELQWLYRSHPGVSW